MITKNKKNNPMIRCDICNLDIPNVLSKSKAYDIEELHLIMKHDGWKVWPDHPASRKRIAAENLPDPLKQGAPRNGLETFFDGLNDLVERLRGKKT